MQTEGSFTSDETPCGNVSSVEVKCHVDIPTIPYSAQRNAPV